MPARRLCQALIAKGEVDERGHSGSRGDATPRPGGCQSSPPGLLHPGNDGSGGNAVQRRKLFRVIAPNSFVLVDDMQQELISVPASFWVCAAPSIEREFSLPNVNTL